MKKFKKMMERMEDAMAAVSFAEEAEFETARDMLGEERRVLLAVREKQIDNKTLKYAVNTCKRVAASLDILYVSSSAPVDSVLDRFMHGLDEEGILYRFVRKTGCLKKAIIDYTDARKQILFVVIKSSDSLDIDCTGKERKLSDSWKNLKCPLVVVSEGAQA
jgi:hypothetical protein